MTMAAAVAAVIQSRAHAAYTALGRYSISKSQSVQSRLLQSEKRTQSQPILRIATGTARSNPVSGRPRKSAIRESARSSRVDSWIGYSGSCLAPAEIHPGTQQQVSRMYPQRTRSPQKVRFLLTELFLRLAIPNCSHLNSSAKPVARTAWHQPRRSTPNRCPRAHWVHQTRGRAVGRGSSRRTRAAPHR